MKIAALGGVLMLLVVVAAGCSNDTAESTGGTTTTSSGGPITTPPPPTVGTHPTHGPHGGELIELGNEEYHAELIHDDASVTIYILDGAATTAVPIEATEIHVNLKHDGQPEQFILAAVPDEGDPQGRSSRFESSDAELAGHLDEEGAEPQLVVVIAGSSYRGSMEHSHGHDHGHSHD